MKQVTTIRVLALLLLAVLALPAMSTAQAPRRGGQLVIAMEGEPPNLDMHTSALNYLRYIAYHVNEQLFTLDSKFQPVPMLAERHKVSPNGKSYTITLRSGVRFHNGEEMTSDDVVASILRWLRRSGLGRVVAPYVDEVRGPDRRTVLITLKEPLPFLLGALAAFRQGAAIYTKAAIEKAGANDPVTDYTGTGPYQLAEWRRGQHVILRRFDGYAARTEAPDGYAGKRVPYLDEIRFVFVREPAVRAVGVQAGDYHFAWPVATDDFARLSADARLEAFRSAPRQYLILLNKSTQSETGNVLIRRAIQAAVDSRELMAGIFGDERFWRLDPAIMWKETAWYTEVGASLYNQANPERARQLLAQAGYRGEPVKMIVSAPERIHLTGSQILRRQLERVGFRITADNMDVNTHRAAQLRPTGWELTTMDSTYREHPVLLLHWGNDYGVWGGMEKDLLMKRILTVSNQQVAKGIWAQMQQLYYSEVPVVKVGDYFDVVAMSKRVQGYKNMPEPFFWNVWLAQ
jgi:peptide/nickel transport system substrate-binding protein